MTLIDTVLYDHVKLIVLSDENTEMLSSFRMPLYRQRQVGSHQKKITCNKKITGGISNLQLECTMYA